MNKIISRYILRLISMFFRLTVLSCSPENPATVNSPDCIGLTAEILVLNNDAKYCIPLWENIILVFSDQKLNEIKTSYDAVFIYLLGKYNIFTGQQELASVWNSQNNKIIKSMQWEAYKQELKRLADAKCQQLQGSS